MNTTAARPQNPKHGGPEERIATKSRLLSKAFFLMLFALYSASGQSLHVPKDPAAPRQPGPPRDTTLYTMGYSHLDTQWRWDYETTIRKYVPATMLDNFQLIEKYPDYTFNFTGANRYMMMKEYYPADYARVKEYVAADRWFPAGSSLEEADALIPSPESLLRNIMYGNLFYRREFGKASNEYMVPDCFGFPASMPSILAHAGLSGFSTQKLTWGSAIGIPFNFGLWEGPDGASVLAALNPGEYVGVVRENLSSSQSWLKRIAENGKASGVFADYMYYGTGDIGGAPAEESVQWIEKSIAGPGPIHVLSTPASRFFDDFSPDRNPRLPKYRGELLLTNHSAGSLTSQSYIKRWNRKNELLARSAEASSVIADWLGGSPYPRETFREAWRLVVGAQFHDILAGTCTPRANEFSWNDQVLALKHFAEGTAEAVGTVARAMNTETSGIPVVVFNPLSIDREDIVQATLTVPAGSPSEVRVFGPDGKEVVSQTIARTGNSRTILFSARVPSLGFSVYDVRLTSAPCAIATALRVSDGLIENGRYRVTVNTAGDVASIFDKQVGRELLAAPHRLEFLYERPREWPAWNMDWEDRQKPPVGFVDGRPTVRVVERGPARVSLEIDREARGSRFIQCIRLAAGEAGERVEFSTQIHWFTPTSSLKAAFPLTVSDSVATYNTGAGTVERTNNNPKKFEVPHHEWFDLTDQSGDYGVSILEDSKFGSDKPADNIVRLTLLFTPGVRGGYKDQASQDFGIHDMLYAVAGHQGDWREGKAEWQAARLNEPLLPFQAPRHGGSLGKSFSFLTVSNPAVALVALKKAEDDETIIVRLLETAGMPARDVHVTLATGITGAREVNGQEQETGSARTTGTSLVCDLAPYQIRAFALSLSPPQRKLASPTSHPLPLSYTADVISSKGEKDGGQFGNSGASLPAEMLPDSIVSGGVLFTLGPKHSNRLNAVACLGQTITLPAGNFNRLYLLAASSTDGHHAQFLVDGTPVPLALGPWSGFIGQWDNRIWDGFVWKENDFSWDNILYEGLTPGYVKTGTIAHHTSHRHLLNGEDDPYAHTYLYKVTLGLPRGATTVVLPHAPGIVILAATVAWNDNDAATPATALHDTLNRPADLYTRFQMTPKPRFSPESVILESGSAISISSRDSQARIYYTVDGTTPTQNSTRYTGPIRPDRTTTLSAVALTPGKNMSVPATAKFYAAYPIAGASYLSHYSPKYPGAGDRTLIDGTRGTTSYANAAWQGFEGEDCRVVLDLGQVRPVHSVTIGALSEMGSWIFYPTSITLAFSEDGTNFSRELTHEFGTPTSMEDGGVRDMSLDTEGVEARYVRVTAKNIGRCPPWHPGAGGKAWIFTDEIIVE